jgi:hypothetical protein
VSDRNLELARQGYEVLNRGEIDRFLTEFVHPDYEFHTGVRVPSIPSAVRGRDGLRAWIQQWYEEPWEGQLHMDVGRIEELDDGRVLALLTLRAKGAGAASRSRPSTRTSSHSGRGSAFGSTASLPGRRRWRPLGSGPDPTGDSCRGERDRHGGGR